MAGLTHIFPIATILLIALFFLGCPNLNKESLECSGQKHMTKRDILIVCIISALYALAAFSGLGDREAPQSFARFEPNEWEVFDLGEETAVSAIRYYPGLNTGNYTIEYSVDGQEWYLLCNQEQDYTSMFKWLDLSCDAFNARYIGVLADSELYLGSMVLYDGSGAIIPQSDIACSEAMTQLFDEQDVIPEAQSYLNSTYFDEIYHARTAFENIEGIYPYEISHPPLGKLIIAIGISLFGMTPFGWRFSGTLFGVLMLPVLYVFIKRLFKKTEVAACATAIFAFDFMHFTQTRIATIDTYGVFFILLMYLFMYLYVSEGDKKNLALSGIFFGIGAACKWTCLYAGAGLGVIWAISWIIRMRNGEKQVWSKFLKDCLFCVAFFVIIPALIYYASYVPYGQAKGMHGIGMLFNPDYAATVAENQKFMFTYHSGVHAEHPYSSRWYQWVINARPILYYLNGFDDGTRSSFGAFLNPVLCWAGLGAMLIIAYLTVAYRDRKAGFILLGYVAQLLPWVFITRTTFEYHYFPSAVFLTLAIAYIFSLIRDGNEKWKPYVYGLTAMSAVLFAVFYPAISGMRVDNVLATNLLKWFNSWPF